MEDQELSGLRLAPLLERAGFEVTATRSAAEGIAQAAAQDFDLILLDLVLPDDSGEHVLHAVLSGKPDTRVMVVSAVEDVGRHVGALDMGAVDFVSKPFREVELLARVRARLRGDHNEPVHMVGVPPGGFGVRDATEVWALAANGNRAARVARMVAPVAGDGDASELELDILRRALIVDGRTIQLSQREFALACHLLRHRGEVCTRRELLAAVWGIDFEARTNVVDVYIGRLRSKISADTIDTIRNVGYRLNAW